MNFNEKTDRELLEEVIKQNITLYKQGIETGKRVNFLFILAILQIIGAVLIVVSSIK